DFLFPRFERANKLVELVSTLRKQHQGGSGLTDTILRLSTTAHVKDVASRQQLPESMRLFVRMYRPHEAREDTVLFPAFRSIVTRKEYEDLGEAFEEKEHRLFGPEGFEKIVAEVAGLEKELYIYELSRFTPPVRG